MSNFPLLNVNFSGVGRITLLLLILAASCLVLLKEAQPVPVLIHAARVFDGENFREGVSLLIADGVVARLDKRELLQIDHAEIIDLGDATLLPGFIELHAHLDYQQVPADIVLKHGVTTVRDVGGPLHRPYGGDGRLRVLSSGPIITAPDGYPIPQLGAENIAVAVATEPQARETVRTLADGGAVAIKVALEPGGEHGAPWASGHHPDSGHAGAQRRTKRWPMLPVDIVKAIVDEAHKRGRKVTAHIGEEEGARIALAAGVDEWAHVPCAPIPKALLQQAAQQKVVVVTTLDAQAKCPGAAGNVRELAELGVELLYGAEIAHPDIPWGIDAEELIDIIQTTGMEPVEALRRATAKAGRYLNIPLLGTLQPGAPADLIAVKGDPIHALKKLEYPDLVMSGGNIVLNNFNQNATVP
ncbi:MAG: amidohydrolase family protein [Methylobacter sp.]